MSNPANKTVTITISGPTGSGKSGIAKLLLTVLKQHGIRTQYTDTVDGRSAASINAPAILRSISDYGVEVNVIESQG